MLPVLIGYFSSPIILEITLPIFAQFSGLLAAWAQITAVKLGCDRSRDAAIATIFF